MHQKLHFKVQHPCEMAFFLAEVFDVPCYELSHTKNSFSIKIPKFCEFFFYSCQDSDFLTRGVVVELNWSIWQQEVEQESSYEEVGLDSLYKKINFVLYTRRDEFPLELFQLEKQGQQGLVLLMEQGIVFRFS